VCVNVCGCVYLCVCVYTVFMYVGVDGCVQMWERDDVSVSEWMEGGRDMDILCVWQHAFNW
jgi:hypothetical protein